MREPTAPKGDAPSIEWRALNRSIFYLTIANVGQLLLWWLLAQDYAQQKAESVSSPGFSLQLIAAGVVSLLIWVGLIVTAFRRMALWKRHGQ